VLVAVAFGYLAWLKRQVNVAQREHDSMKPRFAGIEKQMNRWDPLGPAVEPKRHIVEVLQQLAKAWQGNDKLQFTSFTFSPKEWVMKGGATTDARFELVTRLKQNKELDLFDPSKESCTFESRRIAR